MTSRRALLRRGLAVGGLAGLTATAGCSKTLVETTGVGYYDRLTVTVETGAETDWLGAIEWGDGDLDSSVVVEITGSETLRLPDDLVARRENFWAPVVVEITPFSSLSEGNPLTLTVHGDGRLLGEQTITDSDETAVVRSG